MRKLLRTFQFSHSVYRVVSVLHTRLDGRATPLPADTTTHYALYCTTLEPRPCHDLMCWRDSNAMTHTLCPSPPAATAPKTPFSPCPLHPAASAVGLQCAWCLLHVQDLSSGIHTHTAKGGRCWVKEPRLTFRLDWLLLLWKWGPPEAGRLLPKSLSGAARACTLWLTYMRGLMMLLQQTMLP